MSLYENLLLNLNDAYFDITSIFKWDSLKEEIVELTIKKE